MDRYLIDASNVDQLAPMMDLTPCASNPPNGASALTRAGVHGHTPRRFIAVRGPLLLHQAWRDTAALVDEPLLRQRQQVVGQPVQDAAGRKEEAHHRELQRRD